MVSRQMLRPIHLRMARAALNWTVRQLEEKSGVGRNTISRYEAGSDILANSLESLEKVLTNEGVVFFEEDHAHGTGVGIRKRPRSKG
jgi:transcriptional regulator with XRE-family HTH domain